MGKLDFEFWKKSQKNDQKLQKMRFQGQKELKRGQ